MSSNGSNSTAQFDERLRHLERDQAISDVTMRQFADLFDRFDVTIERMGDVSQSIKELLSVHEHRIAAQEDALSKLTNYLENESSRAKDLHRELQSNIDSAITKAVSEIKTDLEKYKTERKEADVDRKKDDAERDKKIGLLFKGYWILIGAGAVSLFILKNWNALSSLLNT